MTDYGFYRRAQESVVGGSNAPERAPERFVKGVYPTHVKHGRGAFLIDHRGNKYLDFTGCQGHSVLGYADSQVNAALQAELLGGVLHPLPTHHEYETAEALKDSFPYVDQWLFFQSFKTAYLMAESLAVEPQEISDESTSTWWVPKGSVSGMRGETPKVVIIGNALASGMPLFAVGGKFAIMEDGCDLPEFAACNVLPLVAAKVTARLMQTRYDAQRLLDHGKAFIDDFNAVAPEMIQIQADVPSMGQLKGEGPAVFLFMQEAIKAGMFFAKEFRMSFPLIDEYKNALPAIKAILGKLKRGELKLEGEAPR